MIKVENTKSLYGICGVYGIKNSVTKKWYFGSSITIVGSCRGIGGRLRRHFWELKNDRHHNKHLQNSWNKYGLDSFEMYLVEECDPNEARAREKYWITQYSDSVYNIRTDTEFFGRQSWSDERKKRQSGNNHHLYGKKHSKATKRLISENRKGLTASVNHPLFKIGHTEESKKKMSESHKTFTGTKNPFFGKKHSEEVKRINSNKKKKWIEKNGHPGVFLPPKGEYKGVYKSGKNWIAIASIDGKSKSLGSFESSILAAHNYDYHVRIHYPEGAYLNFPDFDYNEFEPKKKF